MAESQYNADSAFDPHPFPYPLTRPGASWCGAAWPVADDDGLRAPDSIRPASLIVLATARFSLHS